MTTAALPPVAPTQFSVDTSGLKDQAAKDAISSLSRLVQAEFTKVLYATRATSGVLVSSPKGYIFSVTVDDSGNVTAIRVRGG